MNANDKSILGFAAIYVVWQLFMMFFNEQDRKDVTVVIRILVGFVIYTIGWLLSSMFFFGTAHAQTFSVPAPQQASPTVIVPGYNTPANTTGACIETMTINGARMDDPSCKKWPTVKGRECASMSMPGFGIAGCYITYPEWGADASTFPERCDEGSYRSRLNCARMEWDRKYTK